MVVRLFECNARPSHTVIGRQRPFVVYRSTPDGRNDFCMERPLAVCGDWVSIEIWRSLVVYGLWALVLGGSA